MTRQTTDTRHDDRARAISRADLNELPVRRYEGPVAFVDTPDILAAAAADIRSERVTGFDTETRPAFSKGENYLPSLVQVATAKCVYLSPLRLQETHAVIAGLLQAPATVKAGVALAYDLRTLNQVFRFAEKSVIDLGVVAKRNDYEQTGVRNLAGIFLGYRIPKGAKTTNWAAPRLTPAQITYAATDAWVSRELYLQFEDAGLLP